MRTQHILLTLFLVIHPIASNRVNAQEPFQEALQEPLHNTLSTCLSQSHSELEKAYCKIQEKKPNNNLPAFDDFQNNPPNMQYLLLKGPARKLNIQLPKPIHSKPPEVTQEIEDQELNTQELIVVKLTPVIRSNIVSPKVLTIEHTQSHDKPKKMQDCKLDNLWIRCNEVNYTLVTNKNNSELEEDALSENNKMNIRERNNEELTDTSSIKYLSKTYPVYIHKMLSIGLGAGTMSFTKYASVYEASEKNQQNFSERMETMFGFLKTDKRGNTIKSRYDTLLPEDITWCMPLDDTLIVCDNINKNWVYEITTE